MTLQPPKEINIFWLPDCYRSGVDYIILWRHEFTFERNLVLEYTILADLFLMTSAHTAIVTYYT